MFRFLPKNVLFFDFFEKHASLIVGAAQKYYESISGPEIGDVTEIKELEHAADAITQQCVEALHKTFITPIDRDQIFHLIKSMDNIIDSIDEAANALIIYKIHQATPTLIRLADILYQTTIEIEICVKRLRKMSDGEESTQVQKKIQNFEHEADIVLNNALSLLFDEEKDVRQIIKWKEIYSVLENATDQCADVANIVEGILLENA